MKINPYIVAALAALLALPANAADMTGVEGNGLSETDQKLNFIVVPSTTYFQECPASPNFGKLPKHRFQPKAFHPVTAAKAVGKKLVKVVKSSASGVKSIVKEAARDAAVVIVEGLFLTSFGLFIIAV